MADDRLQNYVQAMEIDPASNKPIPKVVSQIEGGDGLAKLLVNADGSISVSILGADSNGGALKVILDSSNVILPVEVQAVLPQTVQTHNGVSIPPSGNNASTGWIDTDGYDKVAFVLKNDATIASSIDIRWSFDGSTIHGVDFAQLSGTSQYKTMITDTRARYFQIVAYNGDSAAAHVLNVWGYLKG